MKHLNFLPEGVGLEVGTLVPPNNQIQQFGSMSFQKMRSMYVMNHIGENEERGCKPIILVGSDITVIYSLNNSDYDNRSTLTLN